MIKDRLIRYGSRLRFPKLLALTVTLFLVDLLVPDFIPFVDEPAGSRVDDIRDAEEEMKLLNPVGGRALGDRGYLQQGPGARVEYQNAGFVLIREGEASEPGHVKIKYCHRDH